jgi:hypothetical protein
VQERKQGHLEADERVLDGDRELFSLHPGWLYVELVLWLWVTGWGKLTRSEPTCCDEDRNAKALPLFVVTCGQQSERGADPKR